MRWLLALLLVTALLAGCASSSSDGFTTPTQDAQGRYVINLTSDNKVVPAKAKVPVGATVVWVVGQGGIHDVTSDAGAPESFTSDGEYPGKMKGGNEYDRAFTKAGTYAYKCALHGDMMKATLRVG